MSRPGPWSPDQRQPDTGPSPAGTTATETKKRGGCMKWGLIAFAAMVILGIFGSITGITDTEPTAVEETTTSAAPEPTTEPAPEPEPTPQPEPTPEPPPVDPVQQQQDDLADAIRDEVRDADVTFTDNQVTVVFPISDNLTRGFIISGAQGDTIDILKAVKESGWQGGTPTVIIGGTFNMVDAYGGESIDEILSLTYMPGTMQRVNPDGVQHDRVWQIADERFVHPELRE